MGKARFHYDNTFILNPLRCGSFDVCQVGDLFCGQDYTVPGHRQDCFELSLVVTGKATFSINEEVYTVSKGDLVCNIPGDYHVIRCECCIWAFRLTGNMGAGSVSLSWKSGCVS